MAQALAHPLAAWLQRGALAIDPSRTAAGAWSLIAIGPAIARAQPARVAKTLDGPTAKTKAAKQARMNRAMATSLKRRPVKVTSICRHATLATEKAVQGAARSWPRISPP